MSTPHLVVLGVALLIAALAVAQHLRSRRFRARIEAAIARVWSDSPDADVSMTDRGPPDHWRAWLARSDAAALAAATRVKLHQRGRMRLSPTQAWMPFSAIEVMSALRPDFVWSARMRMVGVPVDVVDELVDGQGGLEARLAGAVTVARATGPEASHGQLLRYLAEIVWIPSALRRLTGLDIEPVGERAVRLSFELGEQLAELAFAFDDDGQPVRVRADSRTRRPGERHPWTGEFWDFREAGGIVIPHAGRVAWELPEGPFVYWEGEIERVEWG